MKSRFWIVLALATILVASNALISPAQAGGGAEEAWSLVGKGQATPPNGDGGDNSDDGSDVEGDPENWLGGQNRPAEVPRSTSLPRLLDWFMSLLNSFTFGLIR